MNLFVSAMLEEPGAQTGFLCDKNAQIGKIIGVNSNLIGY